MVSRRTELKIFITAFVVFAYFSHWAWWACNTNLDLTRAIFHENRFQIDTYANNTGDRSFYDGHYYSDKLPGLSFLSLPVQATWSLVYESAYNPLGQSGSKYYEPRLSDDTISKYTFPGGYELIEETNPGAYLSALQLLSILSTSAVFSALTTVLLYKLLSDLVKNRWAVNVTVATFVIAIPILSYTTLYYHATQAFLTLFSFYLGYMWDKHAKAHYLLSSGVVAGLSWTLSSTSLLLLAIPFYLSMKRKSMMPLFVFPAGMLLGALPMLVYNYSIFSNPFDLAYYHMDPAIWSNFSGGAHGFVLPPSPFIAIRLLIDPYRGMFFYSPVLLLSLVGLWFMSKHAGRGPEAAFILLSLSFLLFMNTIWWAWDGGPAFGPRHLLPAVPLLMIPLAFSLERLPKRMTAQLVSLSAFITVLGLGPWNWAGGNFAVTLADDIQRIAATSLQVFSNPLKDHYLHLFLTNGPRSLLMESLLKGSLDIRMSEMFAANPAPFATMLPLVLFVFLLWRKETSHIGGWLENYPEAVAVPVLASLLLLSV